MYLTKPAHPHLPITSSTQRSRLGQMQQQLQDQAQLNGNLASWFLIAAALASGAALSLHAQPAGPLQIVPSRDGAELTLEWNSVPGSAYQVQARTRLAAGTWANVALVTADGPTTAWADPVPPERARFYRLETLSSLPRTGYEPPTRAPAEPCDCSTARSAPTVSPFVYPFSLEFHYAEEDLRIKGRGPDFVWSRRYRSSLGPNSAQGNGWDFSYNIRVERSGLDLALFDGNTREDTYILQSDGTYAAAQFFRELSIDLDGVPRLTFSDNGFWEFHPLDGGLLEGKIRAITDRNQNSLTLEYNEFGQLDRIIDTLDREIFLTYNPDGFIESVNDFAGRQVTYTYYSDEEPGGSFGDLKSVTSPIVIGTPNGNDFPTGKTSIYTYSEELPDERLNHNLLTITDPKNQTWLQNVYSTEIDPGAPSFDRIQTQTWGDNGQVMTFSQVPQTPGPGNGNAIVKTIANDRVGNVSEFIFDYANRCLSHRVYTGRATPGVITTETENRPVGPLRNDDPPFFERRYEWNIDSLLTRVTEPNGNSTENIYEFALDPETPRRSRGNLRSRRRLPGPLGGDQQELVELFEYDTDLGGCCGFNFVTKATDARSNVTQHSYDERGNRTNTVHRHPSIVDDYEYNGFGQLTARILPDNGSNHRRRDEFTYYDVGPQTGYRHQQIIDVDGFALTTTYEYDIVGNLIRRVDARDHDTLYSVNALDQTVRETSREVSDGSGVRYQRDTFYDANNNVVRIDIPNIDDQGVLQPNTHFTTTQDYDILNYPTRITREVDPGHNVITETAYDANRNQTLVRYGEAVNGNQPANTKTTRYDERDLRFIEIRAEGDIDQSSARYDYDPNGNLSRFSLGIEDTPRVSTYEYDGYDRSVRKVDPMGNTHTSHYDPNGNRLSTRIDGELIDLVGGTDNVRLRETSASYDPIDRMIRSDDAFFNSASQAPIGDGLSTTLRFYNANSQIIRVVDDNGHQTLTTYDTANRRLQVTDNKTNSVSFVYDPNNNVTNLIEIEKSDLLDADDLFVTQYVYDNLDRRVLTIDPVGNHTQYAYDSRNNTVRSLDGRGNETRSSFDGLNRLIQTIRDLNGNGASAADPDDITTSQAWDDSSRLVARTDDNSNVTESIYDPLNRLIMERQADQTTRAMTYDVHDNRVAMVDANNTMLGCGYDLLNRLTSKVITPGPDVSNEITFERYLFDGLSRLVEAEDDDSLLQRAHDSLSRVIRETLNDETTESTYDGVGNQTRCIYPGGRLILTTYDELDRRKTISDTNGLIAVFDYKGPDRVLRRTYGNGTQTEYEYDGILPNPPDDFGVKRIVRTTHSLTNSGNLIDDRTYTWDPVGNKTQRIDERFAAPPLTHTYTYDPVYRLTRTIVTDPDEQALRTTTYDLDGAGNRTEVIGTPDAGLYTCDPTEPEPADCQLHQYTVTPLDFRRYDTNGNLIALDAAGGGPSQATLLYDYRNQMVEYHDLVNGLRHSYAYDPLGRRIRKLVDADGLIGPPQETRFFFDGWQEIEEQDGANVTLATYVFGNGIDEVLEMQRDTDGDGNMDKTFFHGDDLLNVMAVTDATGTALERYDYQDYGEPIIAVHVQTPDGLLGFLSDASTNFVVADDFSSSRTADVNGVRWWGSYSSVPIPPTDDFIIRIHSDDGGQPGAVLREIAVGNDVNRTATGRNLQLGPAEFVYDTAFPEPFSAQPGEIYWLSILNNTAGQPALWGVGTAGNGNGNVAGSDDSGVNWDFGENDLAFEFLTGESALANPLLFNGRRYDPETGFYYYRTRYLDPQMGRFTTRDVIGLWGDPANLGNPLTYAGNNPWSRWDPFGTDQKPKTYLVGWKSPKRHGWAGFPLMSHIGNITFGLSCLISWDCPNGKVEVKDCKVVGNTKVGGGVDGWAKISQTADVRMNTIETAEEDCVCKPGTAKGKRVCTLVNIAVWLDQETTTLLGEMASSSYKPAGTADLKFCCPCECPSSTTTTPPDDSSPSPDGGTGTGTGTTPTTPTGPRGPTSPTVPEGGTGGTTGSRPSGGVGTPSTPPPTTGSNGTQLTYGGRIRNPNREPLGPGGCAYPAPGALTGCGK